MDVILFLALLNNGRGRRSFRCAASQAIENAAKLQNQGDGAFVFKPLIMSAFGAKPTLAAATAPAPHGTGRRRFPNHFAIATDTRRARGADGRRGQADHQCAASGARERSTTATRIASSIMSQWPIPDTKSASSIKAEHAQTHQKPYRTP
jgi:hypothetical protein